MDSAITPGIDLSAQSQRVRFQDAAVKVQALLQEKCSQLAGRFQTQHESLKVFSMDRALRRRFVASRY